MTSSVSARLLPSARPVVIAATLFTLLLGSVACGGGEKSGPPDTAPAPVAAPNVTMTVTVAAASAEGRRDASVRVESTAALVAVQLDFEVPEACQRVAGAATRKIPAMAQGQPLSQGIGLQCPAGTQGVIRVKLTAQDGQGRPVEASAEGAL